MQLCARMRGYNEISAVRQRYYSNLNLIRGSTTLADFRQWLRRDFDATINFTYEREPFRMFREHGKLFELSIFPEPTEDEDLLIQNRHLTGVIAGEVMEAFSPAATYGMLGSITGLVLLQASLDGRQQHLSAATRPQLDAMVDAYTSTELEIDPIPYRLEAYQLTQRVAAERWGTTIVPFWPRQHLHAYLSHLQKLQPQKARQLRMALRTAL